MNSTRIPKLAKTHLGYEIKTENGRILAVRPQMRLHRLVEIPETQTFDIERFWCYSTFEAAVLAALAWEVSPDTEPVGYTRSGGARRY